MEVQPESETRLRLVCSAGPAEPQPVFGHLTLLPHLGLPVQTSAGGHGALDDRGIDWSVGADAGWVEPAGARVSLPAGTRLLWPKLAHDPYRKDGRSSLAQARLVIEMPFRAGRPCYEVLVTVA